MGADEMGKKVEVCGSCGHARLVHSLVNYGAGVGEVERCAFGTLRGGVGCSCRKFVSTESGKSEDEG